MFNNLAKGFENICQFGFIFMQKMWNIEINLVEPKRFYFFTHIIKSLGENRILETWFLIKLHALL